MTVRLWWYDASNSALKRFISDNQITRSNQAVEFVLVGCTTEPQSRPAVERNGIKKLLLAAERGTFDVLGTSSVSVFGKTRAELEPIISGLIKSGVTICTLREGRLCLPDDSCEQQ
jgi:hypothetical protein